jgi:Fe-Mn family superoxide dismutase
MMNDVMRYVVQQQLKPEGLSGISDEQIDQHWALYEGYVKNANALVEALGKLEIGSREWGELKRRVGFEFNGMILHEYYFGNLGAGSRLSSGGELATDLTNTWGTIKVWREDMAKTAAMRGSGWAILYHDSAADRLFNWWVGDHEINHPAGFHPILVLDVWEHAWVVDYGISGREQYIKAFFENINWDIVEQRLRTSKAAHIAACV